MSHCVRCSKYLNPVLCPRLESAYIAPPTCSMQFSSGSSLLNDTPCNLQIANPCFRTRPSLLSKASSRKESTIALSSGEAELVAALSGTCESTGLRQQWIWPLKFGCSDEETTEASQQILCCDSFAALGLIMRKGWTRKTRHIDLKEFFSQQWSARPEVRLVQVGTSEMLADCLTTIQSTPNSVHLSKPGLEIEPSPELI